MDPRRLARPVALAGLLACRASPGPGHALLFVTQVPANRNGDETRGGGPGAVTNTFGNQDPRVAYAPRGGDLMRLGDDGALRNLTEEAGYGERGEHQGSAAIAVREPGVDWTGEKALVSMVVGAPDEPGEVETAHWQIYEVEGIGEGESARLRHLDGQPEDEDNVSPIYAADGRVLYTSTQPVAGNHHQLDEYESSPTVTGIWALREGEEPTLLAHAPSGAFGLTIDSFGRVLYTKWDHLVRDQQGDNPAAAARYHPRTWESEEGDAALVDPRAAPEVFPEPRTPADPTWTGETSRLTTNQFFPWQIDPAGTREETLLHLGRHELGGTPLRPSFLDDPALGDHPGLASENEHTFVQRSGLFGLREDPTTPGLLYATYAYEFFAAGGGSLVRLEVSPEVNPRQVKLEALTEIRSFDPLQRVGSFRDVIPTSTGALIAAYTENDEVLVDRGVDGPDLDYAYRLWLLGARHAWYEPDRPLTPGIERSVTWWEGDALRRWSGTLWELDPVEIVAREVPPEPEPELEAPEATVFAELGIDAPDFQEWLAERNLAVLVARDVTRRDGADHQQPYHLRVPGGVSAGPTSARVYDVAWLQVLQADLVRGYGGSGSTAAIPGRRVLPRPIHGDGIPTREGPPGAVPIARDGSVAALVPAGRALTWQLLDPEGRGVVLERVWASAAPGEIRACPSCHGVNEVDQEGRPAPENPPEALRELLTDWLAGG